jgi:hypothetical protein
MRAMRASTLRTSDLRFLLGVLLPLLTLYAVWARPQRVGLTALVVLLAIAGLEWAWPRLARSPAPLVSGAPWRWVLRRGHHVRAATWDDPASARAGESLWAFLPRTLGGSLRSAWQLEARQRSRLRKPWAASPLLWWTLAAIVWVVALAALGQWKMLVFWVVQSAFAVWLLETVNYIEHYGLQRRCGPDGRQEPFGVQHAWNADHLISNSVLANLQRHSDHHLHAGKP